MKTLTHPTAIVLRALALLALLLGAPLAVAGVPESIDGCRRISEAAKLTGTKALIIGYEGLFSSSWINANALADYRDKLAHGQSATRPLFLFGGSFLTRGPLVKIVEAYKNKVEVLVFWRTLNEGTTSFPAECAKVWMAEKDPDRKVIIVGHSFGGGAAWLLADSLHKLGVPVAGVVTADPRPAHCGGECWPASWSKPANVTEWQNCYQLSPLRGQVVPGASNHFQGYIGHVNVQNTSCVYQGIANIVAGVKGPLTTAPLSHVAGDSQGGNSGALPNPSGITGASKSDSGISESPAASRKIASPAAAVKSLFGGFFAPPTASGPGSAAEKNWMERASQNGSGASEAARLVEAPAGDNEVHYSKLGADAKSAINAKAINASGSSRPAVLQAGGSPAAGGNGADGGLAGPREGGAARAHAQAGTADATSALGAVWAGAMAAGSSPGSSSPSGAPTLASGTPIASLMNQSVGADASIDPTNPSGEIGSPGSSAGSPAEPSADLSLFLRVHEKLTQHAPRS